MSNILLTGATGYVGGTFLDQVLKSEEPSLKSLTIDTAVRTAEQAQKLKETYGDRVNPIKWKGLEDTTTVADTAANYDLVVNVGSGFIPAGAKALVEGLGRRKDGPAPWIVHIAGCTNLADRPLTQDAHPEREWDDEKDAGAIFDFMKEADAREPYPQRSAEVGVLEAAEASGVNAVSLNAPLIFGEGSGLFNRAGLVIPIALRYAITHGYGFKLNETANFDYVHVSDLAALYVLVVRTILERPDRGVGFIPTGRKGIIFPAVARILNTEIMERCVDAAFAGGVLPREGTPKEREVRQVSLQEIADEIMFSQVAVAERGWAGHKAMKGTLGPKLFGWKPQYTEEAWKQEFHDEFVALRDGRRGITLDACIGLRGN
ncbi:hypothetical protein BU24DRAFT_419860 [Aaosphaeria arxii CBS 175.79]|uniref:NAD(P)-binding protein n=1 Tax=Aaosphaeria arxii CBS 175.79 TaxID=1450172 RepID=A0A6A5Y412_9PLEO|nr:uncharacterized protein BU24DRAFT_419860 [Aaosphaeria arxii CBS 175.79]KAF2020315.1 hypothetical protein BU24DRAFT_419860 [Aaosphaeria arxii CBS 175.79]